MDEMNNKTLSQRPKPQHMYPAQPCPSCKLMLSGKYNGLGEQHMWIGMSSIAHRAKQAESSLGSTVSSALVANGAKADLCRGRS